MVSVFESTQNYGLILDVGFTHNNSIFCCDKGIHWKTFISLCIIHLSRVISESFANAVMHQGYNTSVHKKQKLPLTVCIHLNTITIISKTDRVMIADPTGACTLEKPLTERLIYMKV